MEDKLSSAIMEPGFVIVSVVSWINSRHISKHKNALHFKIESFEDASFSHWRR